MTGMKNQLCTRQVCFIMFAYPAAGKLLMLPALLSYYCANDLVFPALFIYLLQTAAVWAVAFACSRTDKTFFALAEEAFGKVVSKILMCLFALFFFLAAFLPMLEQKLFVQSIFYDTIPSLIPFLPFFIFAVYAAAKGIRNAGRAADIALPVFCAAIAAIFIMSFAESNMEWLLPVLRRPASGIFTGIRFGLYNFTDAAVMLMLLGRFEYRKGDCAKITLTYSLGAVLVLVFLALFYSIFSTLAPDQYFAISKVSVFFNALSVVGRIDLIAVYAAEICMLFALALCLQLCVTCICSLLGVRQTEGGRVSTGSAAASLAVNIIAAALVIAFNNSYSAVQLVYGSYLWPVFAVFSFVLPPLVWVLYAAVRRPRRAEGKAR